MSAARFAPRYQKRCSVKREHGWYWTDRPGARYVNAKGNPRYLCPKCAASPGFRLPKGWRAQ